MTLAFQIYDSCPKVGAVPLQCMCINSPLLYARNMTKARKARIESNVLELDQAYLLDDLRLGEENCIF